MSLGLLSASAVYQNVPHGFSRSGEKMRPVVEGRIMVANQFEPRFMDQCCCLECLAGSLLGHLEGCEPSKLMVHNAQQLFGTLGVTVFNCFQDGGGVVHF